MVMVELISCYLIRAEWHSISIHADGSGGVQDFNDDDNRFSRLHSKEEEV